jgi:hypothetical protein
LDGAVDDPVVPAEDDPAGCEPGWLDELEEGEVAGVAAGASPLGDAFAPELGASLASTVEGGFNLLE